MTNEEKRTELGNKIIDLFETSGLDIPECLVVLAELIKTGQAVEKMFKAHVRSVPHPPSGGVQ